MNTLIFFITPKIHFFSKKQQTFKIQPVGVRLERNEINLIRKREADCLPPLNRDGDYQENTDGEREMNQTFQQWKQESQMSDLDNIKLVSAFVNNISCLQLRDNTAELFYFYLLQTKGIE